jgi:hypothetical protein
MALLSHVTPDDWTAIGTGVIAVFTIVLAIVAWWQGRLTRSAIRQTQQSLDLAKREFDLVHRPRIRVRTVTPLNFVKHEQVTISVVVVNVGDSNAFLSDFGFSGIEYDGHNRILHARERPQAPPLIKIKSGERHIYQIVFRDNSEAPTWAALQAGAHDFIAMGEITYEDEAKLVRHTSFARTWGKDSALVVSSLYRDSEYED